MLLVHHRRFEEEITSPLALGTQKHEMDRYRWNILGLCEMRWKNFGEKTKEEGRKVFFSGKEDKHEHALDFLFARTT